MHMAMLHYLQHPTSAINLLMFGFNFPVQSILYVRQRHYNFGYFPNPLLLIFTSTLSYQPCLTSIHSHSVIPNYHSYLLTPIHRRIFSYLTQTPTHTFTPYYSLSLLSLTDSKTNSFSPRLHSGMKCCTQYIFFSHMLTYTPAYGQPCINA